MIDKRLNKEAFKNKGRIIKIVGLTIVTGMLIIAQAYVIASIVDLSFMQKEGLRELLPLFAFLFFIFIMRGTIQYVFSKDNILFASEMKGKLRKRLLQKYKSSSITHASHFKTGEQAALLTSGVDEIDDYYSSYLPQIAKAAIIPLMILIVVFSKNVYSGTIMLITAPLIPVFMAIIGSQAEKKTQQQMESLLKFSSHFLDTLKGIPTLKIFGQSKNQRKQVKLRSDQFRDTTMSVLKIAFISALMLEILSTISTAMIAVEVGLRLVYGHLTFHTALFILLLAPDMYLPLRDLGSSFHSGRNSMSAAEKIWDVLDKKDEKITWGEKGYEGNNPPQIKLENVSYQTESGKEILRNIHMEVNSNERIAIVGPSGAGKTTLLKLMLGLIPQTNGQIYVNGNPLSTYTEQSWFSNLAYVDQFPYLFSATIKENIALGKPDATDEEILEAAKRAGVDQFVKMFKDGYDTFVGEGGRGLSGGEKQRIALARAFLKDATFVVFDEPTAGLDLETENILLQAMEQFSERATVVMVAHRLQTIKDADNIFLLKNGEIVAQGAHETLLETSLHYKELMTIYRGGN